MAEYIKRESAIEAIMSDPPDAHYQSWYAEKINEIHAANVEPVRHGRWIYHTLIDGHIHAECSECHKIRIIDNFCPNCGAKMEGGSD